MNTARDIYEIFSEIMAVPLHALTNESSPNTVNGWDSLKHMRLVLALEDRFDIRFNEKQIVEMLSLGMIIDTTTGLITEPCTTSTDETS